MAITVGTATVTSGNQTTGFSLVINSGVAVDDVLLIGITNRDGTGDPVVVDNDAGGNLWAKVANQNATTNGAVTVWWKRATSGTASKTITVTGCTGSASGVVVPLIGVIKTGTPYGTPVSEANASGDETQAGITTVYPKSRVVLVVGCTSNDTLNPTTYTATDPSTLTEHGEGVSTGGSDCSCSLASNERLTAGATGALNWAQTNGTGASIAFEVYSNEQLVTPTVAIAASAAVSPTVTYGALSLTPTAAIAAGVAIEPTVTYGVLNVTPTAAVASATASDPTVEQPANTIEVTPTPSIAAATASDPVVTYGALSITPTPAIASSGGASPTVTFGALSIAPTQAVATSTASSPTVTFGSLAVTPTQAVAAATAANPTVSYGALVVTPEPAIASGGASSPVVTYGQLSVTPQAASASSSAVSPVVSFGALTVTPTPAVGTATASDPLVEYGGIDPQDFTPTPAIGVATASDPVVTFGALVVVPTPAIADAWVFSPTVSFGALTITPIPAIAIGHATDPTVQGGASLALSSSGNVTGSNDATPTTGVLTASDVGGGDDDGSVITSAISARFLP